MNKYLYLTARSERDSELIHAECYALTKAYPDENGLAISDRSVEVTRSAYVKKCVELMFAVDDIDELLARVEKAQFHQEGFRVSVVKRPSNLSIDSMAFCREVGALIGGRANLDHPTLTYLVIFSPKKIFFGKLISESDVAWSSHSNKPYLNSSSLASRLARTIVNLVAKPSDRLIDPCCGMGTIILEAAQMGIHVTGYDINKKMVFSARKNFEYFNLVGRIEHGDARKISGKYDALVTDLPYGINTQADEQLYRDILRNARSLADKIAVVAAEDMTEFLQELSIEVEQVIPAYKPNFTRYVHVANLNVDCGFRISEL